MPMTSCKGICDTDKFRDQFNTTRKHAKAYVNGYYRCRKCEYYIKDFTYCPCCGVRLATGPRNAKCKRILKMSAGRY
jgi:hypothetical protein